MRPLRFCPHVCCRRMPNESAVEEGGGACRDAGGLSMAIIVGRT